LKGSVYTLQIVATRSTASAVITILAQRRSASGQADTSMFGDRMHWPLLATRGLSGAAAMTLYYISIQLLPLGDAVTIFFSNAVVTALASVCLRLEKPSWLMAVGSATCTGALQACSTVADVVAWHSVSSRRVTAVARTCTVLSFRWCAYM
jgi:drug/metabolite transporter (DMT)-like permease